MPTDKQREAARRNGAKSQGPKTAEGKRISSRNATSHGLYSSDILLWGEAQADFDLLRDEYLLDLQPLGAAETDLAMQVINMSWTLRRAWDSTRVAIETHIAENSDRLNRKFKTPSALLHIGLANAAQTHEGPAASLYRHISRLQRNIQRALRELRILQDRRRNLPPVPNTQPHARPQPALVTPPAPAPAPLETENRQNEPNAALTLVTATRRAESLSSYHCEKLTLVLRPAAAAPDEPHEDPLHAPLKAAA